MRRNGLQMCQGRFRLDTREKLLYRKGLVSTGIRLLREVAESPSLNVFKSIWVWCSGT